MRLLLLLIIGIWLGMLIGISFLEAPLKFQAPNMTMKIAVGVGQLVFRALNKAEIIFSILTLIVLFMRFREFDLVSIVLLAMVVSLILIQSIWLLPLLDERANQIINGQTPEKSSQHLYYVICEMTKVILLIISFIKLYPNE